MEFLDPLGERGDFFIISTKLAAKLIYFHILIIFSLMFHAFPFVASCLSFFLCHDDVFAKRVFVGHA